MKDCELFWKSFKEFERVSAPCRNATAPRLDVHLDIHLDVHGGGGAVLHPGGAAGGERYARAGADERAVLHAERLVFWRAPS